MADFQVPGDQADWHGGVGPHANGHNGKLIPRLQEPIIGSPCDSSHNQHDRGIRIGVARLLHLQGLGCLNILHDAQSVYPQELNAQTCHNMNRVGNCTR